MPVTFAVADFLRYLALALIWTLAGRTVLCAARQKPLGVRGWLLAPVAAQAVVAVVLGLSALVRVPIDSVAPPLWTSILALAVAGPAFELTRKREGHADASDLAGGVSLLLGVALIVPTVALLPYFVHGFGTYAGVTHPDAWSYTVFGDYLAEYPRRTRGGLAPVYEWATNLSNTRFVAPAQLGWLATATREGDTQAAFGLLLTLSTFVVGSTCAAIGHVLGLRGGLLLLVAIGGGAGNWITNAIYISNLDNLLAFSYLPALATLGFDDTPTPPEGRGVVVGLLAAGAVYTYPEFAAVILGCSALFFLHKLVKRPTWRSLASVGVCAFFSGALIWPYASDLLLFLRHQLTAGVSNQTRPAHLIFAGLLDSVRWPAAVWALGPEDVTIASWWLTTAAGGALTILAVLGFVRLAYERRFAPLATIGILACGSAAFLVRYSYGYGAYKFILLGWWLIVIAVVLGVYECAKIHRLAMVVAALLATATFAASITRSVHEARGPLQPDMMTFRALGDIEPLTRSSPVAIAVGDNTALHWATYFLRNSKIKLVSYSGYLATPNFQPSLAGAMPIPWDDLRLLLTDATDGGPIVERQSWKKLWSNSRYALWDTGDIGWAVVWKIEDAYPSAAGPNVIWVGDKPVTIVATANAAGLAEVHADLSVSQPISQAALPIRLLAVDGAGAKCEWVLKEGGYSLSLGLRAGQNVLTLAKTWPVSVELAPTADQRYPFMIGLVGPTLAFNRGATNSLTDCP